MTLLSLMLLISTLIAVILSLLPAALSMKSSFNQDKLSVFECGFDPLKKARAPFSLRFFMVTVVFLIFDIEIALILPLGILESSLDLVWTSLTLLNIIFILIYGLIHEWNQGTLEWTN